MKTPNCICKTCGIQFYLPPPRVARGDGKYCSKKCREAQVKCVCKNCGKEFYEHPSRIVLGRGIYCSTTCRDTGHKIPCTCVICGKAFDAFPSVVKRGRIYCSKQCYGIAISGSANSVYTRVERACVVCGKPFTVKKSVADRGDGDCCSTKCSGIAKNTQVKRTCLYCSKEFYVVKCRADVDSGKFCSRTCSDKYLIGENCAAWKGGMSFGKYCPKFNTQLKNKVRAFFNYKCVVCGKTQAKLGYKLHVHHVDYDKEDGCNGRDPLFVPLCCSHHMATNHNRDGWELFFRYYLALGYDNTCF